MTSQSKKEKLNPNLEEFEQISIRYLKGKLEVLDQTKLPDTELWCHVEVF